MPQPAHMRQRRDRFRAFMAALDGAGDPARAIDRGLYVARKGEIAEQVAARLELRPAARQLVVGGIGTGKTTQLLAARSRLLASNPDALALYLDVSEHQDLGRMKPGSLLALAGLTLAEQFEDPRAEKICQSFGRWARGQWLGDLPQDDPDWDDEFIPGVVTPPTEGLEPDLERHRDRLKQFVAEVLAGREIVLLLDSLDRLTDLAAFQTAIEQDIVALSSIGIGVILVGPLRAIYGLDRALLDRFDHWYRQSAVDVEVGSDGRAFLVEVLHRRAERDMLSDERCEQLAELSGGVLRDLIRLAHHAGEEAYLAGADRIEPPHVEAAAEAFGRSLLMGLTSDELQKLREIHESSKFIETSERDLALLVTRRVLDYQSGAGLSYRVHPTIAPLLAAARD